LLKLQARCKNVCYLMFLPPVVSLLTHTTQTTSIFDDISEEVSVTIKGGSDNSPGTLLSVCYRGL
jgi:hypothetical protein